MGEFLPCVDVFLRLDSVWHLYHENPEAVMLTAALAATLGWYARWFLRDKARLIKYAPYALAALVVGITFETSRINSNRIQITASPVFPWLESPQYRKPNTNYAIRPRILAHRQYNDARVTLLNVYRFIDGGWGIPLNSGVKAQVAWYASNAFEGQTIFPETETYMAPFVISEPGDNLQFQLAPKPQTVEIMRWAESAISPGQYKFVFVLEASNQEPVYFDFFLNWYGAPSTIDFHIDVHS